MIIGALQREELDFVKRSLAEALDMKDLGSLGSFLGVEFILDSNGAWLSQTQYVLDILDRFGTLNCKPVTTPACVAGSHSVGSSALADQKLYQEMVGSLLFLSTRGLDLTSPVQ